MRRRFKSMEVHYVRQMLRTKSIYNIPLRVTFYARVSSEKDELRKSSSRIKFGHQEAIKKMLSLATAVYLAIARTTKNLLLTKIIFKLTIFLI